MLKGLNKIWVDITTNPKSGKYSMNRLQVLLATCMSVGASLPHIIEVHLYPVQSFNFTPPPDWLIYAWLCIGFGFAGLNQYGKIQAKKSESETTSE